MGRLIIVYKLTNSIGIPMSNYSVDANSCRVDLFKRSGKWYASIAIKFRDEDYLKTHPEVALIHALNDYLIDRPGSYAGMTAVCLNPYSFNSHPVMTNIP